MPDIQIAQFIATGVKRAVKTSSSIANSNANSSTFDAMTLLAHYFASNDLNAMRDQFYFKIN